jgi:hypothetical protein
LTGINNHEQIVGSYLSDGKARGFAYSNSQFSQIDFPGAFDTRPISINNKGIVAGTYNDGDNPVRAFTYDGHYDGFDPPAQLIGVGGINDLNQIVGSYAGSAALDYRLFLAFRDYGPE